MSKSKATRAREVARANHELANTQARKKAIDRTPLLSGDIKMAISNVVRTFEFQNGPAGGNCLARAVIGRAVLRACGLRSKLVAGGMLYRAGPDPRRDTLRFCLPDGRGGFSGGRLIGHVWNELGGDIVDFSAGDWQAEAAQIYASETCQDEVALGPVQWTAPPPEFIWQDAETLKSGWRTFGEPGLGKVWYGEWTYGEKRLPDYASFDSVVAMANPHIKQFVADSRLRERVAALRTA